MGFIEDDVKKRAEEKADKKAAAALPVGFIAGDVKKERSPAAKTEPAEQKVAPKAAKSEAIPMGFIAKDVVAHHSKAQ